MLQLVGECNHKLAESFKIQTQTEQTEVAVHTEQPQSAGESTKHCMVVQYRGSLTDQFVHNLYESKVPVQPVVTLRKIRTFVSQLKVKLPQPCYIISNKLQSLLCRSNNSAYMYTSG